MRIFGLLTLFAVASPVQGQEQCRFSVGAERPQATSRGPDEMVRVIKVVDQPDSPLAITTLDLSGLALRASLSQYTLEGTINVELMNISDTPVSRVELSRAAGWRDGFSSARYSFGGVLAPGERRVYTLSGRSRGGTGFPGELTVVVGIEAAWIDDCRHEPAVTVASVMRAPRGQ